MNAETPPASSTPTGPRASFQARNSEKYSAAGPTPDPWDECAKLEHGADRSFAWSVREQVIASPPEGRARLEERLLKALAAPGRTEAGLAFVCQMLALIGSAKCVPALAPLLRDAKTADAARYALERVTGPEADAALRDALAALSGPAKAGLIGSIAVRGDPAARPALAALKASTTEPAIVRDTAARALDRLANHKA
jgi:hypothetical protein